MTSPNPRGRPKKEREYASLIDREMSRYIKLDGADKATAKKRVIARMMVEAVLTGKITFDDGSSRQLDAEQWIGYVMRLLKHLEGDVPERKEHEFINELPVSAPVFERLLERVYGSDDSERSPD